MIHSQCRYPSGRCVTGFADSGGCDMAHRQTVTTGAGAGANNLGMIHRCRCHYPRGGAVTSITNICGCNMSRPFPRCTDSMTLGTDTRPHQLSMIHCRSRRKSGDAMTVLTNICSGGMAGGFADRNTAIVTTDAAALHMGMIHLCHRCPGPRTRKVAGLAGIGGQNMRSWFTQSNRAVVTRETGTNNLTVINLHYRCPVTRCLVVT